MTVLLLFGYSVVNASGQIPPAQLPTGSLGSNTVDIRTTTESATPNTHGAFRARCFYSHMNYDDPIVFPNQIGASHLHTFFGNTKTNANSTYQSLTTSGNSTCEGGIANRSAYWVPTVMTATGNPVPPSFLLVYYKSFTTSTVKNIPNALRMVAGSSKAQNAQDPKVTFWECRNPSNVVVGTGASIPNCPKNSTLKLRVNFPICWDGFNLDSTDHKSHVSYGVKGKCPLSHPVNIPNVGFLVQWNVTTNSTTGWRLSSDMYDQSIPGGYSAHADWFEGWKPEIRTTWFENCLRGSKDCHVGLLDDGEILYNRVVPTRR
ncbi:DUF1996 domain-containing protein [Merismopedia glauca]|nr:DUF1996 domain-containing protein [Merismopedia glauca]